MDGVQTQQYFVSSAQIITSIVIPTIVFCIGLVIAMLIGINKCKQWELDKIVELRRTVNLIISNNKFYDYKRQSNNYLLGINGTWFCYHRLDLEWIGGKSLNFFIGVHKILSILYIFFSGVSSSGSLNAFERLTLRPSKVCIAFYKA